MTESRATRKGVRRVQLEVLATACCAAVASAAVLLLFRADSSLPVAVCVAFFLTLFGGIRLAYARGWQAAALQRGRHERASAEARDES